MYQAFLLRFQESCADIPAAFPSCGTETATAIHAEAPDVDQTQFGKNGRMFPTASAFRNETKTAVAKEQADDHWGMSRNSALPKAASLQTETITFVHAEAADKDQSGNRHQAIPRCSSY